MHGVSLALIGMYRREGMSGMLDVPVMGGCMYHLQTPWICSIVDHIDSFFLSSKHWNLIIQRVLIELAGLMMESRLRHQNHRNHPQLSSATWKEDFRCQSAKATHLIPQLCAVHLYQKNEGSKNTNTAVPACKMAGTPNCTYVSQCI